MPVDARQQQYLEAMGIQLWRERVCSPDAGLQGTGEPPGEPVDAGGWEALAGEVAACTACELHKTRTQTVFGTGDRRAEWLLIGEAPGADEDRQGEPFVGRAGQLLNAMLQAIGLTREQVYIANILKCRPPRNRDPQPAEIACCSDFLRRQIALVQPRLIVAVGRIAAQQLLDTDSAIGKLRGREHVHAASGIPVVVTYHPAYLLRSPLEKRKVWQDLQLAWSISPVAAPRPGGAPVNS